MFWIRLLGTLVCLLLGLTNAIGSLFPPRPRPNWLVAVAFVLHLVFVSLFRLLTRDFPLQKTWHAKVLAVQVALGAVVNGDLVIINALTLPFVLPRSKWSSWLIALVLSVLVATSVEVLEVRDELIKALREQPNQIYLIALSIGQVLLWVFVAFSAAVLIVQIEADRRKLGAMNADLLQSRQLVAESSRSAERLRIARELHDSLGHHLTTLNLNLEICRHLPPSEKEVHIEKAQFLAKLLLADLRDVVSSWRTEEVATLEDEMRGLSHGLAGLDIDFEVELETGLPATDAKTTHTIVRCAQEAVTNALRHANASRIVVALRTKGDALELTVTDDGRGCDDIPRGSGLSGIVDRAVESNGRCWFESGGKDKGFTVRVEIPLILESA